MKIGDHEIEPERLYTPDLTARLFNKTTGSLATDRCMRRGPAFIKVGRQVYYRGSDLIAFITSCEVPTGAQAAMISAAERAARRREGTPS